MKANILMDSWMPVLLANGNEAKIAIWQLTEKINGHSVVDVVLPRPDLKNGLYQLLIGIIQVMVTPKNEKEWKEKWFTPPSSKELKTAFAKYEECFVLNNPEGPAFMQDYNYEELANAKEAKPIYTMLISSPSENTIKNNVDHFVKRDFLRVMDVYFAGLSLFSFQQYGPAVGAGYRVGLRGGGPMTSILIPKPDENLIEKSLWQKIWANIQLESTLDKWNCNLAKKEIADIFPWMALTRTSAKNEITSPNDVHPFQMLFSMPSRMRLEFGGPEVCGLTSEKTQISVAGFRTLPSGIRYLGPWRHPLCAYVIDPKKPSEDPLSKKGQPGGLSYRHWSSYNSSSTTSSKKYIAQKPIVLDAAEREEFRCKILSEDGFEHWVAGFDMDNAKVRCWYETSFPYFHFNSEKREEIEALVSELIDFAMSVLLSVKQVIKLSWSDRPGDLKGDLSHVDVSFWEHTESDFYTILKNFSDLEDLDDELAIAREFVSWEKTLKKEAYELFNKWTLGIDQSAANMKRIVNASQTLEKFLSKIFKENKEKREMVKQEVANGN